MGAHLLAFILAFASPSTRATPRHMGQPGRKTIKVVVLNYDPILREHGNVRLHQYMKWFDPHIHTTNIVKHLNEASGGFADYKVIEFIDVDAFPEKRDGFDYDEKSFLEMW